MRRQALRKFKAERLASEHAAVKAANMRLESLKAQEPEFFSALGGEETLSDGQTREAVLASRINSLNK